jgi:hypothetical protein
MATYEYECPYGHITERRVKLEDREQTTACDHPGCPYEAEFVLSATPTTFRAQDRKAFKRQGR